MADELKAAGSAVEAAGGLGAAKPLAAAAPGAGAASDAILAASPGAGASGPASLAVRYPTLDVDQIAELHDLVRFMPRGVEVFF